MKNDDNARWLEPAFAEAYRVLKSGGFCVSFYGWNQADKFLTAWRGAGFRPIGHVVFRKRYPLAKRVLSYHHEQAYLLAKGQVQMPLLPIPDVLDWRYERNEFHPTQKPLLVLTSLIDGFTSPGDVVLDPFCGRRPETWCSWVARWSSALSGRVWLLTPTPAWKEHR